VAGGGRFAEVGKKGPELVAAGVVHTLSLPVKRLSGRRLTSSEGLFIPFNEAL
jgi:hypothetical protein